MEVGGRGVQGRKVGGRSQRAGNLRNRYADQGRLRDSVTLRDQIITFESLINKDNPREPFPKEVPIASAVASSIKLQCSSSKENRM